MKIGIIRTSSIGDVVLATAVLEFLRLTDEAINVVWVGREPVLSLIAAGRKNVETLDLPSRASRQVVQATIDALKTCDVVIDLQTTFRTKQLLRRLSQLNVPVVSADKQKWQRLKLVCKARLRGRFAPLNSNDIGGNEFQFEMMRDAAVRGMARAGIMASSATKAATPRLIRESFQLTDETWHRELSFGSWIALAPGASHQTKRAPVEVMSQVVKYLSSTKLGGSAGIVFLGGAEDRAAALEFLDVTPWQGPVLNLAGKLTLAQTTSILAKVQGLLCNDSGLAHIAEAVGTPVAVLFGPTIEAFGFSPRDPRSRAFSSNIGCRPCSKHGKSRCRYGDKLCFLTIDTRAVANHVLGFFAKEGVQA
jgi:ADP-heptose:LPS heptosyltransferase